MREPDRDIEPRLKNLAARMGEASRRKISVALRAACKPPYRAIAGSIQHYR
ncbi:hypothetical protein ACVWZ4_000944 [Bradyrhizobium sp. USDA 4472]